MKKIHYLLMACCVALYFRAERAPAQEERVVRQELKHTVPLYRNTKSPEPFLVLQPGQKVLISTKNIKGFYRIKLIDDPARRRGYVRIEDLQKQKRRSEFVFSRKEKKENSRLLIGISASGSWQGESELSAGAGQDFVVSSFLGFGYRGLLAWERSFSGIWRIRFFFNYRILELNGDAGLEGSAENSEKVERQQTLISGGMLFLKPFTEASQAWWGVGGEIAKLTKSVTTIGSADAVESDVSSAPLRYFIQLHFGYDFGGSSWKVVPDLSLGVVANTQPITVFTEASLNFAVPF